MDMYGADGLQHGQNLGEGLQPTQTADPRGDTRKDVCRCEYISNV